MRTISVLVTALTAACNVAGRPIGPHPSSSTSASAPTSPAPTAATPTSAATTASLPDVSGLAPDAATATLRAAGFANVATDEELCDGARAGLVCGTRPEPGPGRETAALVTLVVNPASAAAYDELVVPNLHGLTVDRANAALRKAGFTAPAEVTDSIPEDSGPACNDGSAVDRVCSQSPAAGRTWARRSTVEVQLGMRAP